MSSLIVAIDQPQPALLQPLARAETRSYLAGKDARFHGFDLWHAYDLSWLNERGFPQVAVGRFQVPASTPCLPESKSFKNYLNSFAQCRLSWADLKTRLEADLSACLDEAVAVDLLTLTDFKPASGLSGLCLDEPGIETSCYNYEAGFLQLSDRTRTVKEKLHTHVLRTCCPLTGQPDWASLYIAYTGPAICHAGLLRYIVSYRLYAGFHEHVVERIFHDIHTGCRPDELVVYACFQRRGGLDINPYRSSQPTMQFPLLRTSRQ